QALADPNPAANLPALEQELDASQSRQAELASEIEAISRDEATLSQKLVELGETIQSREAAITAGEERLASIESEAVTIRSNVGSGRAEIARLLAGLQLIDRNPPPALVVEPHDVLAALRGAMMFGTIVPELKDSAAALSHELARLDDLRGRTTAEQ